MSKSNATSSDAQKPRAAKSKAPKTSARQKSQKRPANRQTTKLSERKNQSINSNVKSAAVRKSQAAKPKAQKTSKSPKPQAKTIKPESDESAVDQQANKPLDSNSAAIEDPLDRIDEAVKELHASTGSDDQPVPEGISSKSETSLEQVPPVSKSIAVDTPVGAGSAPEVKADISTQAPDMRTKTIENDSAPAGVPEPVVNSGSVSKNDGKSDNNGASGGTGNFHKRLGPVDFSKSLQAGLRAVRHNLGVVMIFTCATNILVLSIPIYLFQISDRVLTSRSTDTLIMLTTVIVGAVILQSIFDAIRRFILMRTAVEVAAQLGSPILSAAARASLHSSGKEYQTLGDLQQVRSFLVSATLLSFLDGPFAPLFILAIFLIHPQLGMIVVSTALLLLIVALINQRLTAAPFGEANIHQSKANLHLDSMSRNSQIINALAMIPEAVRIWGRDTASSLRAQVIAQDRNIITTAMSKGIRLLTQVGMLGWGAFLAIQGEITGGMVIAASIIAGRALAPIEGAIEGWNQFLLSRAAYGRISSLLKASPLNFERLQLPCPEGKLDVERLLFVPQGTKRVVLNGIGFSLTPGECLAVIGNSGAGKTTLGKMLVGSILPTSGNVRLDRMDIRNWDQRQFGENIGYLPQDVQLFPGTIKDNICRMRADAEDSQIYEAAVLADVHEMIASFPEGYETKVAADGAPLSGGQKQRIALARAFFGNPRFVVLDEPNSNLDSAGDEALARALQHAKRNKITMVSITQKPSLLKYVDKIMLLTNGTVSLFGSRQDVLTALANQQQNPVHGYVG